MTKHNDIIPPTDLTNSREYYGMYNSRDFYKGTSFKMSGEWCPNTHYFNDEYIVDFVSFNGALLSCMRSHLSSSAGADVPELIIEGEKIIGLKPNRFWSFVMAGQEGPEGKSWVPHVSPEGDLTWSLEGEPPVDPVNIKGQKGDTGKTPEMGVKKIDGEFYWTAEGQLVYDPETHQPVKASGPEGKRGANGDVYVPSIVNKDMVFTLTRDVTDPTIVVDFSTFRGDPGWNPRFTLKENGELYYHYDEDPTERYLGKVKGAKGDQGEIGPVGPAPEMYLKFDASEGMTILYYRRDEGDWVRLGAVGGMPGKSPKLIRVFGDPETHEDDRILWGYDGVPVSEWTVLCYLDELKGDENIAYGCPETFVGGEPEHNKIWYDPCDEAVDKFHIDQFLYQAYLLTGGTLSEEKFYEIFSHIGLEEGWSIKFATSFEELGEPTSDKQKTFWLVPTTEPVEHNAYDEYIVINTGSEESASYEWEKIGSASIDVDLSNYYKKFEVDELLALKEDVIGDLDDIRSGSAAGKAAAGKLVDVTRQNDGTLTMPRLAVRGESTFNEDIIIRYEMGHPINVGADMMNMQQNIQENAQKIRMIQYDPDNLTTRILNKTSLEGDVNVTGNLVIKNPEGSDTVNVFTELQKKQDKLIAGENITIVGNVISATGGGSAESLVLEYTVSGQGLVSNFNQTAAQKAANVPVYEKIRNQRPKQVILRMVRGSEFYVFNTTILNVADDNTIEFKAYNQDGVDNFQVHGTVNTGNDLVTRTFTDYLLQARLTAGDNVQINNNIVSAFSLNDMFVEYTLANDRKGFYQTAAQLTSNKTAYFKMRVARPRLILIKIVDGSNSYIFPSSNLLFDDAEIIFQGYLQTEKENLHISGKVLDDDNLEYGIFDDLTLQEKLVAGDNITIVGNVISATGGGGTSDYNNLTNKPSIGGNELSGNKTAHQLGLADLNDLDDKQNKLTAGEGIDITSEVISADFSAVDMTVENIVNFLNE